jgi:hypothetical protein
LFSTLSLANKYATLLNLYGKIKNSLGFGIIEDEDVEENPSGFGTSE